MQTYRTISGVSTATITEKKSEFISVASFVDTQSAALEFIQDIRKQNKDAAHNVFAYVLRENSCSRHSDDGEPSKTAGLPTLDAIIHADLCDCIVVTTRYFGGTLLGTGGLVRAYSAAAKNALECAKIVTMSSLVRCSAIIAYPLYEQANRLITLNGAVPEEPVFTDSVTINFVFPAGKEDFFSSCLQELCKGCAKLSFSTPFYAPF